MKQQGRLLEITTPLGPDKLLLRRLSGRMELGRLFEFSLALSSPDPSIKFNDIVGQNVTVGIRLADDSPRCLNGYISQFEQVDSQGLRHSEYRATLVPWLWFLTRTSDCRIFQEKKVPEILKQVFGDNGFTDVEDRLSAGNYRKWEYCVQYRETDFNFVSRLMEQEGIYYYFKHESGKHTLVLCDSLSKHDPFPGYDSIQFQRADDKNKNEESVLTWSVSQSVQPGAYVHKEYNFTTPKTALRSQFELPAQHSQARGEIYDYPGEYENGGEGDQYAKVRMQELRAPHEVVRGTSDARGLATGYRFKLTDYAREDQNREYLVTAAQYNAVASQLESGAAEGVESFDCSFEGIPSDVQFRPARLTPKPIVQGPQTAVVTGPAGEEVWPDQYGRVKVQFHWDRYGKKDEKTTCWIRCMQSMAGRGWGAMFIPRIGQEVVVSFLEGDPDDPLITGLVYNADQMPAYPLPQEKTKSYLKTNSSKGGDGYNEVRFEDAKGKEQIFVHGEKDYDLRVKNDRRERVFGNQHMIVGWEKDGKKGGDLREMVYEDHHVKVHKNRVEHIGGDMQLLVGGVDGGEGNQDILLKGGRKEKLEKGHDLEIGGDRKEKLGGNQSLTVGGNQQEKIGQKHAVEAGQEIHLKAGMKVIIEAGMQLTLKGPGGFVDIGPAGVTIQGTMVLINSGGAAGAGSGSSPTAPEKPQEAKPAAPAIADNSKTGRKSSD